MSGNDKLIIVAWNPQPLTIQDRTSYCVYVVPDGRAETVIDGVKETYASVVIPLRVLTAISVTTKFHIGGFEIESEPSLVLTVYAARW